VCLGVLSWLSWSLVILRGLSPDDEDYWSWCIVEHAGALLVEEGKIARNQAFRKTLFVKFGLDEKLLEEKGDSEDANKKFRNEVTKVFVNTRKISLGALSSGVCLDGTLISGTLHILA